MSLINETILTCNDWQKFKELINNGALSKCDPLIEDEEETVGLRTKDCIPEKEIEQLSLVNPGLILTADYYYNSEDFKIIHTKEVENGKSLEIGLKPVYFFNGDYDIIDFTHTPEGDRLYDLLDEALDYFYSIDIIKETKKGVKYVDYLSGISISVENEKFKMQLSKEGSIIKVINCFIKAEETIIVSFLTPLFFKDLGHYW